jgi:predicted DNA-binding transcriptional regulator YafY
MSRIADRQLAILLILASGHKIAVWKIAEQIEASVKTIYRDLIDLSAKYPINIERGRYGGVWMAPAAAVGRQYLTKAELAYAFNVISARPVEDGEIRSSILKKICHGGQNT